MADDDLDRELSSPEHDASTRQTILYERFRRGSNRPARLHWINVVTLAVALVGALFAGLGAWPVIEGMVDKDWFDL